MPLRGVFRSLMDTTTDHQRNVPTTDSTGGPVANWTAVASGLPCAIWPTDSVPEIASAFAKRDIVTSHVLCFDADRGAKAADRFLEGSDAYVVMGTMHYRNARLIGRPLYLVAANLRTV